MFLLLSVRHVAREGCNVIYTTSVTHRCRVTGDRWKYKRLCMRNILLRSDVSFPPCHPSCKCWVVLERESSESWWISTLFLACEIDGGAWNGFLRFSRKRTDLSKKKLHSLCILTKVYQSAKEERFWIFDPCHQSAIIGRFLHGFALKPSLA